jgi:hypothetical protein
VTRSVSARLDQELVDWTDQKVKELNEKVKELNEVLGNNSKINKTTIIRNVLGNNFKKINRTIIIKIALERLKQSLELDDMMNDLDDIRDRLIFSQRIKKIVKAVKK